jgi:diguanylate cyclase (GGDEF)-like protein
LNVAAKDKRTFFDFITSKSDRNEVRNAMNGLRGSPDSVLLRNVSTRYGKSLVSIEYIPEIGWYAIAMIDLDRVLPLGQFNTIALIYIVATIVALLAIVGFLNTQLIAPIELLHAAMWKLSSGQVISEDLPKHSVTEIRWLMGAFAKMASEISASRHELEEKVRDRTAELDKLTRSDALTELLNRRGMSDALERTLRDWKPGHDGIGLLWFDVDYFKDVNDGHGHHVGDAALKLIASTIKVHTRPCDALSRWGGDEFLVMLSHTGEQQMDLIAERICLAVREISLLGKAKEPIQLTVSVGGYFCKQIESIDSMLEKADQALYAAKGDGRNCYRRHRDVIDPRSG